MASGMGVHWTQALMAGAIVTIVGKIVWDWLKNPRGQCLVHEATIKNMDDKFVQGTKKMDSIKVDMLVVKDNIEHVKEEITEVKTSLAYIKGKLDGKKEAKT